MVLTLWLYGFEHRLLHAPMYVSEISKFAHSTYIISNQVDRSVNDRVCRQVLEFVHGSYWWWYFQLDARSKNDREYS